MRTKAQARERVRQFLVDPNDQVWSDDSIDYHVLESYGSLTMQAKVIYASSSIGDVADQSNYALPTGFQQLIRCTWDNMTVPQRYESELSNADKNWQTETGDVIGYTLDAITGLLRKWKTPSVTDATKFKCEHFKRGASLSSDATEFEVPVWMVDILEFRAVAKCLAQEGDGQDFEGAGWWMKQWERGLLKIKTMKGGLVRNSNNVMGGLSGGSSGPPFVQYPHAYSGPRTVR